MDFINNQFIKDRIYLGDISDEKKWYDVGTNWDLITAIDVLEHLNDNELDNTLNLMKENGERFIFSIPFIGDPNLEEDSTHKQFKTKDEWKELIKSHGINVSDAPKDWFFAHQILVGIK